MNGYFNLGDWLVIIAYLGGIIGLGLPPGAAARRVQSAAQDDDAINASGQFGVGGEASLQGIQQPFAGRQERHQQGERAGQRQNSAAQFVKERVRGQEQEHRAAHQQNHQQTVRGDESPHQF